MVPSLAVLGLAEMTAGPIQWTQGSDLKRKEDGVTVPLRLVRCEQRQHFLVLPVRPMHRCHSSVPI